MQHEMQHEIPFNIVPINQENISYLIKSLLQFLQIVQALLIIRIDTPI